MIKEFIMKQMLKRQLGHLPKEQQELFLTLIEKDPKLFEQMAKELDVEMKKGGNQLAAAMRVMPKYKDKIQALMQNSKK